MMQKLLIVGWAATCRGEVTLQAWRRRVPTRKRWI